MSAFCDIHTGAARPPYCFGLLRRFFAVLLMLAGGAQAALAAQCQYVRYSPALVEGFIGSESFGVQLILRDSRWLWQRAPGGVLAFCPSCASSDISKSLFRIGQAPFLSPVQDGELRGETGQESASALDFALHPRAIAIALWQITSLLPSKVEPLTEIAPFTMWGVSGKARVVTVASGDKVVPGVAVSLEDGCFTMFAVFFRKDDGEVSIDDVVSARGSMEIVKYQPPPHVLSPGIHFPLGDARKKWEEDQK